MFVVGAVQLTVTLPLASVVARTLVGGSGSSVEVVPAKVLKYLAAAWYDARPTQSRTLGSRISCESWRLSWNSTSRSVAAISLLAVLLLNASIT